MRARNPKEEVYSTDVCTLAASTLRKDSPEQRQETEASSNDCDRLPFLSKADLVRLTKRDDWRKSVKSSDTTADSANKRRRLWPLVDHGSVIFPILIIMANCLTASAESMVTELATPTTRRPPIDIDEAMIDIRRNHAVSFVPGGPVLSRTVLLSWPIRIAVFIQRHFDQLLLSVNIILMCTYIIIVHVSWYRLCFISSIRHIHD